ncbi:MAG: chloride channel protein [Kiritimatiellia bacterium]
MRNIFNKLIAWRESHVSQRQFILVLSLMVGVVSSLAAFLLKSSIQFIQHILTSDLSREDMSYWYLVFPVTGIILTALFVRYMVKDDISHGITRILYAISQKRSILKLHNTWTSLVGSSLTIGFGGSVGAEAPIVLTGSAMGSNLGRLFRMDQKTIMLLVGCGAAGAIAGIFKAPMAGLVFTLEVLMLDMTLTAIVPILVSSVTATACSYILSGKSFVFEFGTYEPFMVARIPYLVLLGIVCGLVSLYFTRGMNRLENIFRRVRNPYRRIALCGGILSLLIFLFPPLYGQGYETVEALLNGRSASVLDQSLFRGLHDHAWAMIAYLALIVFFKVFASAATNGAGGVGGIFAPTLFIGCLTGFVVVRVFNVFGFDLPEGNSALAGMSGLMSGVMHAPLTGIFLIAELTGGYNLFMTLMIVSTCSYLTIIMFEKHSLYAMRLAEKGELITHDKDKAVLTLLKTENVLETDLTELAPAMTLGELVKVISTSKRNIFPVVNPDTRELLGVLSLDEIRSIMFQPDLYSEYTVEKLMNAPPATIRRDFSMEKVMRTFEETGAWNLPVVDWQKRYVGFVSKSKIFSLYRHVLVNFANIEPGGK